VWSLLIDKTMVTKWGGKRKKWLKVAIFGLVVIGLSAGLYFLMGYLEARFGALSQEFALAAYLVIFGIVFLSNAAVIIPLPFAAVFLVAATSRQDPLLVALVASVAGSVGEITGYYAGYVGKKIISDEHMENYGKIAGWVQRHGSKAVFFMALQPVLPFDVAGLVAGALKMPLRKFLFFCWAGKLPKYLLLCYGGMQVVALFPIWFSG